MDTPRKRQSSSECFEKLMSDVMSKVSLGPADAAPMSTDSWESFERCGNELFVAGKYDRAIAAYSDAIELKRQVAPKEVADLLANRAAAYFADEKPMDAFWDCQSALFVQPGHLKATLRLAKAQAALAKYEEARDLLVASPYTTRPEFKFEISRMNRLVRESQNGDYDLKSMLKEAAASKTPRLDHADYNAGVREKWISDEKENGLISQRDFVPGDLLFVCKAFMAVYATECEPAASGATRRECLIRTIRRISKNDDLVKELYRLYAGPELTRFDEARRNAALASFLVTRNDLFDRDEPMSKVIEVALKSAAEFASGLSYKNRFDHSVSAVYTTLGVAYHVNREWLKAAKAFEMALQAGVGNGRDDDDSFNYNALTRNALFLCFKIACNYLNGRDFAKAKKYLAKAQTAAKISWGSADVELLKMLYPDLPVENIFKMLN